MKPPPLESYYLAPGATPSSPALTPISALPERVGRGSLAFTLRHPDPAHCASVGFFFECLPDPVGVIYHFLCLARARLSDSREWSRPHIVIDLVDEPTGAEGGRITLSRAWGEALMVAAEQGRPIEDITAELKGVLLHQAARCLLHDGNGTAPTWLLAAIADTVRIAGHLGDPAWRVGCGERGWEEGGGGLFLAWLMGEDARERVPEKEESPAYRRGPYPDLVKQLDGALATQPYDEGWWTDMCGAPLPQLWAEFLGTA